MSTNLPKGRDSSGITESNSDSENSSSSGTSGSEWECSSVKQSSVQKPHFSVTSCDTGLKLKIAAVPPRKVSPKKVTKPTVKKKSEPKPVQHIKDRTPVKKKKNQLSETSSSSESCSRCSSDSSSDDDIPLKTVSKSLSSKCSPQKTLEKASKNSTAKSESEEEKKVSEDVKNNALKVCKEKSAPKTSIVKKTKSDENNDPVPKRNRSRPRSKFASPAPETVPCGSSSSSSSSASSSTSSSSSSSSSSDSDTAEAAAGPAHSAVDDSSAALAAACPLQVIDDADLAELFPEQTSSASAQQPNFPTFHNPPLDNDDKSIADNGDGSSSEMEITPQLVTAAIQRATADSSGSENECSNSETCQQNTTHYASSLLQQFVAQTQLLSSTTPLTPMNSSATSSLNCGLNTNSIDSVSGISDCVLGQITNLPIAANFLNNSQHMSPQHEFSHINKDLEDITSVTESVDISISNPPSLEDCVDNNDFMNLDITQGGSELGSAGDLMKSSPLTIVSVDINPLSQIDTQKLDTISTNSIESQDDVKNIIVESRRKRGRPRKVRKPNEYQNKSVESQKEDKSVVNVVVNFHNNNNNDPPNVSPDSGILSNHNSPTHSPMRRQEVDESHSRQRRRSIQKENNTKERRAIRSKSKSRNHVQTRSDSSDCEYQKKTLENEVKEIKIEAPSPVPLKQEQTRLEKNKRLDHKLDIAALDRMLYATDRVLYPPRKKVGRKPQNKTKSTSKNSPKTLKDKNQYDTGDSEEESIPSNRSVLSGVYAKRKELNSKLASLPKKNNKSFGNAWRDNQSENEAVADDPLDPTWKQIDLNPKYKDILSGYKSDHEFKPYKSCSRLIESGYKSDYGCRSGYKSDYYRSGYKSDHKSGYKSDKSGYKTDYSVKSMRRRMKKLKKTRSVRDRSYYKNQKHFVSDQEILQLTNKTFNCLTLGNSSSDSECESYLRKPSSSPKYVSVCTKYPLPSKYGYGFSRMNKRNILRSNTSDPFAPGPVFSGLQRPVTTFNIFKVGNNNNNTLLKSPSKVSVNNVNPLPALKPVFTHKFGASPICTLAKLPGSKKENINNLKFFTRTSLPKHRKQSKNGSTIFSNTIKKDASLKPLQNIFEKARNTYVPNKALTRNVFLNFKKYHVKPSFHTKKQKRIVLAPPKINLKPAERPSRVTIKSESKHHRHRSKKRHRSRSVSKCREYSKGEYSKADSVDQKFCQDMDTLISNFIKLCQIAPKVVTNLTHIQSKLCEKSIPESIPNKVAKRGAKKRKTLDNLEIVIPSSKRRHKKQLTESQTKGGKDTNEHKLPLKKRHYHINSSTNNTLSLSLVTTEFDENSKNGSSPEKFLCTETDCLGEELNRESPKIKTFHEKSKKNDMKNCSQTSTHELKSVDSTLKLQKINNDVNESNLVNEMDEINSTFENSVPNLQNAGDDDLLIKKPGAEQSELSKKIYETSVKLKAVHKMVHELEKSLPKTKDDEVKHEATKQECHKIASPKSDCKSSPTRHSAPIVTPKKRHRLEADKTTCHSSLDQVVQSLSKKLTEEKSSNMNNLKEIKDVNQNNSKEEAQESENIEMVHTSNAITTNSNTTIDPLKSMSARSLYKSTIPPAQKSEIMTRKKNRLEGLTSNLVSKINPSAATKVLDTLLNNNIRKSIESRILEKEKNSADCTKTPDSKSKDSPQINTRATVIKSPVSKGKVLEVKKSKTFETLPEQTIVVNVDKPTGIFEPSVDLEDQIPKSSICVNNLLSDTTKKLKTKSETKTPGILLNQIDNEPDIPLALITETSEPVIRPKRGESIASVLSDKIQETTSGHNLRQTKRNLSNENDDGVDNKKKKKLNNILRESKLVLPTKLLVPKIQAERISLIDTSKKINLQSKTITENEDKDIKNIEMSKKKARRRKAINRTGFPSIKKKKKKLDPNSNQNNASDSHFTSEDTDNNSAFERVPKDGEAMSSFLERTKSRKPELKVVLNKDECPKQGRLTVVALEKLQGKEIKVDNKTKNCHNSDVSISERKTTSTCILRAPALHLKQNEKDLRIHVNKWEILSETGSIRSLTSLVSNDPEDSIPLSLLNSKPDKSTNGLANLDRTKRKTRAMSPSHEVEEILSKRKLVEKNSKVLLRPKSSLAVLCPSERRLTRSSDNVTEEAKIKNKKVENKKITIEEVRVKPVSVVTRRKSRLCQMNKKNLEVQSSSRESSLDTVVSRRLNCKSREASVDTLRDHDENDPLPLNEKEIDFEKSIDVISKNIISKKRVASSRDDSPASSVENRDKPIISKRNPRLRKKFLAAGLFSDYYKGDIKTEGKCKSSVTHTEFAPGLLAAPSYCERWVRRRLQHYTLPYDIWWQHHYNQPVPSWNYKKIRTNVYYDVKPSAEECESVACNCAQTSGCNEDCINRLVYSECSPQLCPSGDKCRNQRIQRHEWASGLEKFMTENKGWGVRTKHKITSGDFILEYVGEVVSDKEFKERMATRYARDTHHYCLHLDGGLVIDGHRMGGDGRFVNHSCSPNCEMQKWTSNGTFRMALFALRDIDPGEELTYDYNFSLFNPAVGQPCKCDSEDCRGVIGGKSQRITKLPVKTQSRTPSSTSTQSIASNGNQSRVGRPRKAVKCNKKSEQQLAVSTCDIKNMTILKYQQHLNKLWQEPQMKPLTPKEKTLVKERHCFLFRNLETVRRIRDRLALALPSSPPSPPPCAPAGAPPPPVLNVNPLTLPDTMNPEVFIKRLQMLRSMRDDNVKRLVRLDDDPTLSRKERLNNVYKALYAAIVSAKDDKGKPLCTLLLKTKIELLKSQDTSVAVDLSTIESNIERGEYENVAQFDADVNGFFSAVIREHGRISTLGTVTSQLKKMYNSAKSDFAEHLSKILGPDESLPAGFLQKSKSEEVIMCICGLVVEEGLMVQCGGAGCGVWQHARCMRVADTAHPHYCHLCAPNKVDREIPLDEYTDEGHQFYLTLMRGDLQVRQGDTVYVLRDIPIDEKHPDVSQKNGEKSESTKTKRVDRKKVKSIAKGKEKSDDSTQNKEGEVRKHTYQTIGEIPVSELDIFRVERLWKHKDTQERYVYGHHYLRPHETFHEPTRKFFHNEVMRVPLYEAVPIELVMSQCWVMDLNTYCKGRPVGASEPHVYICELRVDRTARLFTKISRPHYPLCTNPYAFTHFPQRLRITRTYAPHEVSPEYLKGRAAKNAAPADKPNKNTSNKDAKKKIPAITYPEPLKNGALSSAAVPRTSAHQKERVNNIARRLLRRGGARATLDASYLLAPRRTTRAAS